MRHPLLGAVISQREQRPTVGHQLLGALRDRRKRVATDLQRACEILCGAVHIAPGELILVGERDGMDHEIETAPARLDLVDTASMVAASVTSQWPTTIRRFLGQRLDPLLQWSPW
jgi:hypothetical protein